MFEKDRFNFERKSIDKTEGCQEIKNESQGFRPRYYGMFPTIWDLKFEIQISVGQ
jgi:hypothetical protein